MDTGLSCPQAASEAVVLVLFVGLLEDEKLFETIRAGRRVVGESEERLGYENSMDRADGPRVNSRMEGSCRRAYVDMVGLGRGFLIFTALVEKMVGAGVFQPS